MKTINLKQIIPFLSTLILLIFLSISNEKEKTNLKLLIWETPQLSLGKYLAISTGTGFILSYFLTSKLSNANKLRINNSLKYKVDIENDQSIEYIDNNFKKSVDKTLIERNINEPSPTLDANFRVIGNTEKINTNFIDNNFQYDDSNEFEEEYDDQQDKNTTIFHEQSISSDWNDESFLSW